MKIAFNPSTVAALIAPPNNKDITFDLRGQNIFARGVKFCGTDTNTWRDIKINNVSIDSNILDLRDGDNTTLTNINGVVTINSTWRPVVDNLTSDSTTSSLSANQGRILKALIDGKSDSDHNHDGRYLKLTGGTMASNALITFADSGSWGTDKGPQGARGGLYWTGQSDYAKLYAEETAGDNLDLVIQFGDDNSNGLSIRNNANTQTSYISAGGVITTGTFKGNLDWSYITNKPVTATRWPSWDEIANKPNTFTPSDHNHDYLIVNAANEESFNSAYHNFQVLYAGGGNGITGRPTGVDAFGLIKLRAAYGWSGQMLLANGGSLYIRSSEDAQMTNTLAWKTILDSSNYSGILDSRYYTESESDNRFVNITGDTMSGTLTITKYGPTIHNYVNGSWAYQRYTAYDSTHNNMYDIGTYYTRDTFEIRRNGSDTWAFSPNTFYGFANNTYYLGTSSYRWANIYSTFGNFSSTVIAGKFHSNASASTDLTVIPPDTAIALETGNGNGSVNAWIWRENYTSSNWGIFHNNSEDDSINFVGNNRIRVKISLGSNSLKVGGTEVSLEGHTHDSRYLRKDTNDSTPYQYTFTKTDGHAIKVGTVRGTAVGSQTGDYIHLYERVAIGSPSGWGSRSAPSYGLATYGGAWLATDTGNVGIGTTVPIQKLHVNGSVFLGKTDLDNTPFTDSLQILANSSNESYNENFNESNQSFGITFIRDWKTGGYRTKQGGIYSVGSGNWRAGLAFRVKNNTTENGTHDITAMWISPAGNVGIGTTSPAMKLHVNGNGIYLNSTATCGINMYSSHGESSISYKSNGGIRTVFGTYLNRTFLWNESIGEHVSILSSNGYFGIGATPYYKLHVAGDIYTTTGFKKNGSSDSYVLLGGGGHKLESSLNVANADKVDGFHASGLFRDLGWWTDSETHDANDITGNGAVFAYTEHSNVPNIGVLITFKGGSDGYRWQMSKSYRSKSLHIRQRNGDNGTWSNWLRLLDESDLTWNNIAGKPSSFTPSEHTHSWTSITDKIVAGNEFNIVNAGFNSDMYFNYLPINDRNSTAYINSYIFGNGHQGLALVQASGFIKNGSSSNYVLLGDGGHKAISDFASSSHSHNYAANENYGGFTKSGRLPISGFYQSEESESGGNAPWSSWMHLINCQHSNTNNNYALQIAASFYDNNTFKIRVTSDNVNNAWRDIIHSGNIGSQSVNYANSAGNADTATNAYHLRINSANTWSTWYWAGQDGQPSWLWGSNDGTNMYVWDPNNFNVNTAQYLRSLGNQNCQTGRTQNYGDVYTYNTIYGNTGAPTDYTSVIGFGRGIGGTVEIAGGWCNTGLYWRSLRDCCEDWYSWRTVLDSSNYTGYVDNYYWANVKISTSSNTQTQPSVNTIYANNWFRSQGDSGWYNESYGGGIWMNDSNWIKTYGGKSFYCDNQIYSSNSIKMSNILLEHTDEINNSANGGLHLNYRSSGNVTLCIGGGNVGISNSSPSYKLDVNGQMRASGFHHSSMNSDNYILLAGGGYKSFGGNYDNPIFLGYLNLDHGNDGTVSSSFYCLGYSVSFTYTRGGNYCRIYIPDTSYQTFYIRAATASVNYSGGGMDTWTGYRRGDGAWWLHCYAYGSNEVRVKGFRLANDTNDSWWGGNPLWSSNGGANRITVCIFGYVTFK